MFKKTSKILSAIVVLTLTFLMVAQPLYAANIDEYYGSKEIGDEDAGIELYWNNVYSVRLNMDFSNPKIDITATVTGHTGTTFKNGTVLLEKLNGSKYEEVEKWTNLSSSTCIFKFEDSSITRSKGTYKITVTVTAVKNGSQEVISENKVSTYK